jgi:hypothetical protein
VKLIRRTIRAVAIVARDGKIPKPLRGAAALGLLPLPGPFDEAVLLLVGGILWIFYPDRIRYAWQLSGRTSFPPQASDVSRRPSSASNPKA